jgi:hypothetical protein
MALALVAALTACNLPGSSTMITQNPAGRPAAATMPIQATQTERPTNSPTETATPSASPVLMTIVPNTPTWSVYHYTCALAAGGASMTMNLAWKDRSNSEAGYRVYRDKQVIATLPPNATAYVDVVFVATGKTVSYSVEAFNPAWQFSTPTITAGCQ